MSDTPETKIAQTLDVRLLAQLLGKGDGKATLNVINIGTVTVATPTAAPPAAIATEPDGLRGRIFEILQQLPEDDRMGHLATLALAAAREVFGTDREAARFLGISPRVFCYRQQRNTGKGKVIALRREGDDG